ncbi:hypothetical protein ColTof4_14366 [Colletotrichum tofieldiae]|nr:hypothetical protein ColTof4_14366 [Colletotrichum tofieldiae]
MLTPGSASTIHIQVMHANQLDLDGAYEAAYSALLPGGWLVHIEAHPESEVTKRGSMHVIHTDSRAQQLVDLVPEKLQRTGFTSLSLCTGRTMIQKSAVDGVEAQAFNSELWEM